MKKSLNWNENLIKVKLTHNHINLGKIFQIENIV